MKSLRSTTALACQLSSTKCSRSALTPLQTPATRSPSLSAACATTTLHLHHQRRLFFSNPFTPGVQSLTATRTLPYPSTLLYEIIADVSSYHSFVPFCRGSEVTKYSNPDANGKRWPEEGKLVVGFNDDISESFYSRVYCVPGTSVEAVSGATETSLPADQIAHHNPRPADSQDPSRNATVLTHLLTRWSLRPFPFKPAPLGADKNPLEAGTQLPAREQTEVSLAIDFAFANPLYAAMSAAAAPKVADKMIQAFEQRVKELLDGPSMGGTDRSTGALEGLLSGGRNKSP